MGDHNQASDTSLVIFMPSGRRGRTAVGTTLLDAARESGVDIESICGGRVVCGKCKVKIEEGEFQKHGIHSAASHVTPPGQDEREYLAEHGMSGYRLSCVAHVLGDVLVTVPEESQARKQIVRKAAGERVIEVDPAVRQVYVEVEPARLEAPRGVERPGRRRSAAPAVVESDSARPGNLAEVQRHQPRRLSNEERLDVAPSRLGKS